MKIRINIEEIIKAPAKETLNGDYLIQKAGYDVYVNKSGYILSVHRLNDQWSYLVGVLERDTYFDSLPSNKQIKKLASQTVYLENNCCFNTVWDYEQFISADGKPELQIEMITDTYYVDGTSKFVSSHHKVDENYFDENYRSLAIATVYNAPKNEKRDGIRFCTSSIPVV